MNTEDTIILVFIILILFIISSFVLALSYLGYKIFKNKQINSKPTKSTPSTTTPKPTKQTTPTTQQTSTNSILANNNTTVQNIVNGNEPKHPVAPMPVSPGYQIQPIINKYFPNAVQGSTCSNDNSTIIDPTKGNIMKFISMQGKVYTTKNPIQTTRPLPTYYLFDQLDLTKNTLLMYYFINQGTKPPISSVECASIDLSNPEVLNSGAFKITYDATTQNFSINFMNTGAMVLTQVE